MSAASPETTRRVLALTLPGLLCELAEERLLWGRTPSAQKKPLGVVLVSGSEPKKADSKSSLDAKGAPPKTISATAKLCAVNESARRYGVREGQSIAEACALVASLVVREVTLTEVQETLGRVAEVGLSLGATVAVEAPDTVFVDITGSAHLQGGEAALASEFANRVRGMGHRVRLAISDGPRLARAFAQWFMPEAAEPEDRGVCVVPSQRTLSALSALPLKALPIQSETVSWFGRLGVLTVGDLRALPKQTLGSRLSEDMAQVSELLAGRDSAPLVAYTPERTIIETSVWDEPIAGSEPLLFVLGGLVSRVSARLTGRGEAAQSLVLTVSYDPSIARFRAEKPEHTLRFKLATPLHRQDEMRRILSARVSRLRLAAPCVGLELEVPKLVPAVARQLELSQVFAGITVGAGADDEIPVLVAELSGEIGEEKVGTLELLDSHRPEAKSKLGQSQFTPSTERTARLRKTEPSFVEQAPPGAPTRLLSEPYELHAPLRVGVSVAIERSLYTIEHLRFEQRLQNVEWWGHAPVTRDYVRLWLQGSNGGFEAVAYVDRDNGRRYLHAVAD